MATHLGAGLEILEEALSGWTTDLDDIWFDRDRPSQRAVPISAWATWDAKTALASADKLTKLEAT